MCKNESVKKKLTRTIVIRLVFSLSGVSLGCLSSVPCVVVVGVVGVAFGDRITCLREQISRCRGG